MDTRKEEKALSDEEDSSFERIEEDSQLETSASEDEVDKEEETFEVVQDELVQARAQIERLKKERKQDIVILYAAAVIVSVILAMTRAAPPELPSCPAPQECPVQAPPVCPPDGYAPRNISFRWGLGSHKEKGFRHEESFVSWIDENSNAARAGLRVDDEIIAVGDDVIIAADTHKIRNKILAFDDAVKLTVRTNPHGATKMWWAKKRAHEEGARAGVAIGRKEGWHEGWRQTGPVFAFAGAAVALYTVYGCRDNSPPATSKKEQKGATDKKKVVSAEVNNSESEDEEEEGETKDEEKELEIEEIIERACKVIRAELIAAKDKNEEPMKSSAHVDELMRGWLENTLDENLKRNDDLLNL